MGTRIERAKRLVARLKDLGASYIFDENHEKLIRVDLPADSVIALQRVGHTEILTAQVSAHLPEIADIVRGEQKVPEVVVPPETEKLEKRLSDVMEAFELVLIDHRFEGVKIKQVWKELNLGLGYSAFCQRVRKLVKLGMLSMTKTPKSVHNRYNLSHKYREMKGEVMFRHPPISPAPSLEEPNLLNGLPYTPSSELRTHLGNVIEGLEILQVNLPPLLALLLDMDRDFERYGKVKEKLGNLKKELAGVGL
jgi:hypothetical protein